MDITGNNINPSYIEHEGFTYLEFNGEYFKGCKRCFGAGHYAFNGEHDRCYICDNTSAKLGEHLESKAAAEKWCHGKAMARANRIRKAEAKRNEAVLAMEANQAALKQADAEVYEFLMAVVIEEDTQDLYSTYDEWAAATQQDGHTKLERDSFIRTMAETLRWVAPAKPFTPKMVDAVRRTMEKRAAQATEAAAHPVVEGRGVITGEIVGTKMVDGDYGIAYKITVKDDRGFRIYCTVPRAMADSAYDDDGHGWFPRSKGRRVTFTATVTASTDDPSFGFGSRPTKGAWL
jgi:hypothetical protein